MWCNQKFTTKKHHGICFYHPKPSQPFQGLNPIPPSFMEWAEKEIKHTVSLGLKGSNMAYTGSFPGYFMAYYFSGPQPTWDSWMRWLLYRSGVFLPSWAHKIFGLQENDLCGWQLLVVMNSISESSDFEMSI
jgi:hypothetical protein